MIRDIIVDEARRARDDLVKRHGGLDGWIDHLQAVDREHRRLMRPSTKKPVATSRKRRISSASNASTATPSTD